MADHDQHRTQETGFRRMSQRADAADADEMMEVASERAGDFQQKLIDEVRARPMRAVGWAAAAGFVLGFMLTR